MKYYNTDFDCSLQVDTEEEIASVIFAHTGMEHASKEASVQILKLVLEKFRPDLFEEEEEVTL